METNDPSLFQHWIKHWNDLVKFEIIEIEIDKIKVPGQDNLPGMKK
jgi:hypothetical protein